jgi:hypothetical protein
MKLEAHLFGSADEGSPSPLARARAERELALLLDPAEAELGVAFDRIERELRALFAQCTESLEVLVGALTELRDMPADELRSSLAAFEELLEALVMHHDLWGATR